MNDTRFFLRDGQLHVHGDDWLLCACGNYHRTVSVGQRQERQTRTPEAFAANGMYTIEASASPERDSG